MGFKESKTNGSLFYQEGKKKVSGKTVCWGYFLKTGFDKDIFYKTNTIEKKSIFFVLFLFFFKEKYLCLVDVDIMKKYFSYNFGEKIWEKLNAPWRKETEFHRYK